MCNCQALRYSSIIRANSPIDMLFHIHRNIQSESREIPPFVFSCINIVYIRNRYCKMIALSFRLMLCCRFFSPLFTFNITLQYASLVAKIE